MQCFLTPYYIWKQQLDYSQLIKNANVHLTLNSRYKIIEKYVPGPNISTGIKEKRLEDETSNMEKIKSSLRKIREK